MTSRNTINVIGKYRFADVYFIPISVSGTLKHKRVQPMKMYIPEVFRNRTEKIIDCLEKLDKRKSFKKIMTT